MIVQRERHLQGSALGVEGKDQSEGKLSNSHTYIVHLSTALS